MEISWDETGMNCNGMEWDRTEKYVPWTNLGILHAQKALFKSPCLRKLHFSTVNTPSSKKVLPHSGEKNFLDKGASLRTSPPSIQLGCKTSPVDTGLKGSLKFRTTNKLFKF